MPEPGPLVLWRAYVPKWAHDPLSGEGARRFGGRWNAAGERCLYLALEISTAFAEYNQGFVQHPALIAQLVLSNARLADLTDSTNLQAFGLTPSIHRCEWRARLDEGKTPDTHKVAKQLHGTGFDGVIYPSFMSLGGRCVALWRWNGAGEPKLVVVDPDGRLPKNASSWP
jgi:RES domain-containing protein